MRTILLVGGLVAALMLNVATVALGSVATLVSTVFETVTGLTSVKTGLTTDIEVGNRKVAALEAEGKLLAFLVARSELHQCQFEGRAVPLDAIEEATEPGQVAGGVHAAFEGHVIVAVMLPLGCDGGDGYAAVLRPR